MNEHAERLQRLALGWSEYRRRQRAVILAWLGALLAGALVVVAPQALKLFGNFIGCVAGSLLLLALGTQFWFIQFRCPNCRRHFHLATYGGMTRGRRCPHCGLERYQYD